MRSALEYAHNHRLALMRFFDDGRLVLDNSRSERAIKAVALGRKAWLFCGSDDHAKSTASLFSVIASARLHGIEPEEYLRCLIRLVPMWPNDRMLERELNLWIGQYVADMENPAPAVRSRKPLRSAKIVVEDVPGQPGWYRCALQLRPHFKYMGAAFTLSLVGKLDKT